MLLCCFAVRCQDREDIGLFRFNIQVGVGAKSLKRDARIMGCLLHLRKNNPIHNWMTIGYDVLRECLVSDFCSKHYTINKSDEIWKSGIPIPRVRVSLVSMTLASWRKLFWLFDIPQGSGAQSKMLECGGML